MVAQNLRLKIAPATCMLAIALGAAACSQDEELSSQFGAIRIELQQDQSIDPFKGTDEIIVTVTYEECLVQFYYYDRTDLQMEDEQGASIFAAWEDRICAKSDPTDPFKSEEGFVQCELAADGFEQQILGPDALNTLRIKLLVESDELHRRTIRIGPIPTRELTGCNPQVRLNGGSAVIGLKDKMPLWQIVAYTNEPVASPDSNSSIAVKVAP